MKTVTSYTFRANVFGNTELVMSAGRWNNRDNAAQAAARWLLQAVAESIAFPAVEICDVVEIDLEP